MKKDVNIFGLKNKVTVVIGAAKGIGKETVRLLIDQGANVVGVDIDEKALSEASKEIEKKTGRVPMVFKTNVMEEREVVNLFDKIENELGNIDILINLVGGGQPADFPNINLKDWNKIFDFNVKSCFLCTREAVKRMNKGKIINVSSIAGQRCSVLQGAHYSAAKAAVIGFTRHLARELGPRGINVNCVAPGVTLTKRIEEQMSEQKEDNLVNTLPLRRLPTAKEQAKVILFFASDLSSYVTGDTLAVSGGALLV